MKMSMGKEDASLVPETTTIRNIRILNRQSCNVHPPSIILCSNGELVFKFDSALGIMDSFLEWLDQGSGWAGVEVALR